MSNVKAINIEGQLPFDCAGHEALMPYLALLSGPTLGVRIQWSDGPIVMQPNKHGGETAIYGFSLRGEEALAWGWIDGFKAAVVQAGGSIHGDVTRDIEGGDSC